MRHANTNNPSAPSVGATPEQQAQRERCSPATGSPPVSASEILQVATALENNAGLRDVAVGSKTPICAWERKALREAEAIRHCANVLKRHAEYISRQVEHSNNE